MNKIYILYDKLYDICKIGISIDEKRRCREINSRYYNGGNNIKIIKCYKNFGIFEKILLSLFSDERIKHPSKIKNKSDGRTEWFNIDYNLIIKFIENIFIKNNVVESEIYKYLDKEVFKYIKDNKLYL